MESELIDIQQFSAVDIRVGTIRTARDFEKAHKPAYILEIDFGPLGLKKSSAQITERYRTEDLIGCQVLAVVNLPPRQIAHIMSECLVLGLVGSEEGVVLIQPGQMVQNGLRLA